jgi:predicted RNA-binding protein with PUA domain
VWDATIESQTADQINALHVFGVNDVYAGGSYQIDVQLTVPAGIRRAGPTALQVIE